MLLCKLMIYNNITVVPRTGIEPVTNCLEGNCSIL